MLIRAPRVVFRLVGFLALTSVGLFRYFIHTQVLRRQWRYEDRARWVSQVAGQTLRCLGVKVASQGPLPDRGLLVCNHLSYLDIVVLASLRPLVFVSKKEVRDWPWIGWLTRCAGTLFIDREKRSDVVRIGDQLTEALQEGVVVVLFPEGTSTDGHRVLPFRSSLLAPAAAAALPVTPAWLGYELDDGSVENEVCYWRDMTFLPHFLGLLGKRAIRAKVAFAEGSFRNADRKELAKALHDKVCALGKMPLESPDRV